MNGRQEPVAPEDVASFDQSVCALEPIQFPDAIQPHGALLAVLAEPPWLVTHASANLLAILGRPAEAVLGQPLEAAIGMAATRILRQAGSYAGSGLNRAYHLPGPHGGTLHLQSHRTGRHICVDIEALSLVPGLSPPVAVAQSVLETFRQARDCQQLCERAVDGLRAISGYDRVMAYRFDEDGHGEVIAEARDEHVEPCIGQHYPASDIPQQARRLFLRHRVGSIADSSYVPVMLLIDPELDNGAQLDLSHSVLRSVSPIHRQYMRNMLTAASLTISLADGPNLWGLLVCHHLTARAPGPELRSTVDLIGQVVSLLIGRLHEIEVRTHLAQRSEIMQGLIAQLSAPMPLPEAIAAAQVHLLGLFGASGAILKFADNLVCIGHTPPAPLAERALDMLLRDAGGDVFAVDDLVRRDSQFAACARYASGALLLPIDQQAGEAILWFRPEKLATIIWGCDPNERATKANDAGPPAARVSFAPTKQMVRERSASWTQGDVALARDLRRAIEDETARRVRLQLVHETQQRQQQKAELLGAITALRVSEGNLNAAEMRLERAQATAGIGSWEMNVATGQLLWSKELFKIRGIEPGELDANIDNTLPFTHPDDREARQLWLAEILAGGSPGPYEGKIVRPSGEVRLVRIDGGAITDTAGSITHIAGTLQDVTERRQIERQLAHAQKMDALGSLTGGMAHDFNNMLGVVMVNLDLLKRLVAANAAAVELCGEALDGANRCADLIRSLLAFARRQPLHPERTDVNALVNETVRLLRRTLGEHIVLGMDLDAKLWPATVDPAQLEAALVNLATNARDAMPKGGRLDIITRNIQLDVIYSTEHPDVKVGDYVLIEVSDTGAGIGAEIIGRIFDPFFTTKAPGSGTGLGLSMAFGFAKQSDGHLAVYSETGLGTTFRLYLPRTEAGAQPAVAAPDIGSVVGNGETVLIVEDNDQLRRAAARQLVQLGYLVLDAEHGDAALTILSGTERVDLLFSDVVMPGSIDGVELARLATQLRPGLPVLLTSGFPGMRSGEPTHVTRSPWTVLSKPYSRDKLARAVRELLHERHAVAY
jgi:PAS domain S-box-containing protein